MSEVDPANDIAMMQNALALAHEAAADNEVPVGAIVVHEGEIVGRGRNACIGLNDPSAHAEMLAMREAAQVVGNYRLSGMTLYSTLEPCAMCAGAMVHARIKRLVYATDDPRAGAAGSVLNVLSHPELNHHTDITTGVAAQASADLLRDFFRARR